MKKNTHWYLVSYDVRDEKRRRNLYKLLNGWGERIQYSVFRVYLTPTKLEKIRWQIGTILSDDDDLMIVKLCSSCSKRVIDSSRDWKKDPSKFEVI